MPQQDDPLLFQSIPDLSRRLLDREFSVEELVRAHIARTERVEPQLNSYIRFDPETALRVARERDAEIKNNEARGPFHGIPVSLKDVFDRKGIATTAGARFLENEIPNSDAEVTERLMEAGAILMGKANLNKFAGGESGDNPDYGRLNNPWNIENSPSGSSGGSAAQVSAGLVALSLGSDNGGSVRNPAAVCNVVGFKPTYGRISTRGMFPRAYSIDHAGILTRRVEDAAFALKVLSGRRGDDTTASDRGVDDYSEQLDVSGSEIRTLAVDRNWTRYGEPAVLENFTRQVDLLSNNGFEVVDIELPQPEEMRACLYTIFFCEFGSAHEPWMRSQPREYDGGTRGALLIPAVDYLKAQRVRTILQKRTAEAMRPVDAVVSPTYPLSKRRHGPLPTLNGGRMTNDDALHYTMPFDLLGYPAISLPGGFAADDAPLGLQFAARPFEEAKLLRIAYQYEQLTRFYEKHPQL